MLRVSCGPSIVSSSYRAAQRAIYTKAALSNLNKHSKALTQPKCQGASQAMLAATGLRIEEMHCPQIGIGSVWYEGNPCNMHLLELGTQIKKSIEAYRSPEFEGYHVSDSNTSSPFREMIGYQFNTIGVSDGISMGTPGMAYSLPSRELIADSFEAIVSAQHYDGCVAIPGCDKNLPGCLMGLLRLNRPSLIVYGGTIKPGKSKLSDETLDVVSAFQSYGSFLSGKITEEQRLDVIRHSCPGAGACGGMYTANTMACALEAMGMMLPYSSSNPAESRSKPKECLEVGAAMHRLLRDDLKPLEIVTKESLINAFRVAVALGGSTNVVLHLLAIARTAGIPFSLDEFAFYSKNTPLLADLKPSGKYVMEDVGKIGGTPAVMKYLWQRGYLNSDVLTVTGKTLEENLCDAPDLNFDTQDIIRPVESALQKEGHIKILYGNLASKGAVAKLTGKEGNNFRGPARVFDSEEAMLEALANREIMKGDVVVIRYVGPKGGPGMKEMLNPTSAIVGAGLAKDVALITDGRFSGGSHGFIIGHVCPEAQEGGNIALVQDGDTISVCAESSSIDVDLDDAELNRRRAAWRAPPTKASSGFLWKYAHCVGDASGGCICDPGRTEAPVVTSRAESRLYAATQRM